MAPTNPSGDSCTQVTGGDLARRGCRLVRARVRGPGGAVRRTPRDDRRVPRRHRRRLDPRPHLTGRPLPAVPRRRYGAVAGAVAAPADLGRRRGPRRAASRSSATPGIPSTPTSTGCATPACRRSARPPTTSDATGRRSARASAHDRPATTCRQVGTGSIAQIAGDLDALAELGADVVLDTNPDHPDDRRPSTDDWRTLESIAHHVHTVWSR